MPTLSVSKRRVAAYARVSTDNDEQYTSYEAQVDYYTKYIKNNPDWEFVKVYTDEGITGTSTKHRDGFNEMVSDALSGKIDLILTKSVSRFARNTVDSLVTIRKLKEKGIEVFFEKENIWTLDSKGELFLTIMSSLAQEESRSISLNVTWGKRKSASDGKVSVGYSHFLGYEKGADGNMVINPEQAEVIKRIYKDYMSGKTPCGIADGLMADGILSPCGNKRWHVSTVLSILQNEKYKGAALLQKTFTTDFLSKKIKVNEGEVPQYYVENSHEAIIPPDEWDMVQKEIVRRKSLGRSYSGNSIFATKLVCGDCSSFFGPKTWNSTDKYRRVVWQCNQKFTKGKSKCCTPHLSEDEIKDAFVKAYNRLFQDKDEIIANCELIKTQYSDCSKIDAEHDEITREIEVVVELTQKCIDENSTQAKNQDEFLARYNGYVERYEGLKARLAKVDTDKKLRLSRADAFNTFIETLKKADGALLEFDSQLFLHLVDKVKVMRDKTLVFVFENGTEIIV
jgi:DNA invertase Pin-like site-specific DNA recombinase